MARQLRIEYPGAFYHITSRGNERKPVFKSQGDRGKFLEYLESASERYEAVIHVYCLMDNHYHLLIETPAGNLSRIMQHINGAYTTYLNVKRQRSGHLFQGRYKSILVQADEYAKELSRYIHLNPVRAGMVETPEEYEWSSYPYYAVKNKKPEWLFTDFILGYFGKKYSTAQREYKEFVSSMTGKKYKSPLAEVSFSVVLGLSDFVNEIKGEFLSREKKDRNLPALNGQTDRPGMAAISKAIDSIAEKNDKLARQIKLHFCHRYTGLKLAEIGKSFGIGESGVTQASRRFSERLKKDRKLRKTTERIKKKLNL